MKSCNYLEQSSFQNLGANESDDSPARRRAGAAGVGGGGKSEPLAQTSAVPRRRGAALILFNAIKLRALALPSRDSFLSLGVTLGSGSCLSRVLPWPGGSSLGAPGATQGLGSPRQPAQNGGSTIQPPDSCCRSFPEPEEMEGFGLPQTPGLALTGAVPRGGGGPRFTALANRTSSRISQACHRRPQTLRGGVDAWVLFSPHLPPLAPRPPRHRGSSANLRLKSHPPLSGKPHHY